MKVTVTGASRQGNGRATLLGKRPSATAFRPVVAGESRDPSSYTAVTIPVNSHTIAQRRDKAHNYSGSSNSSNDRLPLPETPVKIKKGRSKAGKLKDEKSPVKSPSR